MKKITTTLLLGLLVSFLFTACTNEPSDDSSDDQNSTYWPTKVDNNWVFASDGEETTMKIIGIDEIDGSKYYKFDQMIGGSSSIDAQSSVWIKKNNGDYYIKMGEINFDYSGYTGKMTGYQFVFFKDYLEVNQTWDGTYSNTTSYNIPDFPSIITTVNYSGKILERDSSLTVNGTTYKDVIKFSLTLNASIAGQASSETIVTYWIAKNVGIIKMDSNGHISELKSFVIK